MNIEILIDKINSQLPEDEREAIAMLDEIIERLKQLKDTLK